VSFFPNVGSTVQYLLLVPVSWAAFEARGDVLDRGKFRERRGKPVSSTGLAHEMPREAKQVLYVAIAFGVE